MNRGEGRETMDPIQTTGAGARRAAVCAAALLLAASLGAAPAAAQPAQIAERGERAQARDAFFSAPELREAGVLERGGYAVVIDLDENELHFVRGRTVLWSAPVATGMDLRLQAGDRSWRFSTPAGVYQVQHKEENPVWYASDWYFIENRLPVPPANHPSRRFPGGLGAAAVYIGHGLAVHGTDKPDLLGQRVSHGCIRLSNDDAQRLFHNVQIGTQVIIVGRPPREEPGRLVPGRVPGAGPVDARTERMRQQAKATRERRLRALAAMPLDSVAGRLETALASRGAGAADAAWTHAAGELLRRAVVEKDVDAAEAMLRAAPAPRDARVRAEYGTYLADLSERGGVAMIEALGTMDRRGGARAAAAIVEATIGLYPGDPGGAALPWPSRRWAPAAMDERTARGFAVLGAAERSFREARAGGAASAGTAEAGR